MKEGGLHCRRGEWTVCETDYLLAAPPTSARDEVSQAPTSRLCLKVAHYRVPKPRVQVGDSSATRRGDSVLHKRIAYYKRGSIARVCPGRVAHDQFFLSQVLLSFAGPIGDSSADEEARLRVAEEEDRLSTNEAVL